jgi:hypothetical protein
LFSSFFASSGEPETSERLTSVPVGLTTTTFFSLVDFVELSSAVFARRVGNSSLSLEYDSEVVVSSLYYDLLLLLLKNPLFNQKLTVFTQIFSNSIISPFGST